MADIATMLFERDDFIALYPELAARYHDCKAVDYVLYAQQEGGNLLVTLPQHVQRICIIIAAKTSVRLHHNMVSSAYQLIHLESYAQLHVVQSFSYNAQDCKLDVSCFGQASSSFIFSGWYIQPITASITVYLQAERAQAQLIMGMHMQEAVLANFTTLQHHAAPHTTSSLLLKGLVQDGARCVHTGTIHIDACAEHSDAQLHSRFMLLGNGAQAYAQPILQVLNNQVRCAHGSAIGSCDDQQLFYLHSRGLEGDQAKKLLSDAFLDDVRLSCIC